MSELSISGKDPNFDKAIKDRISAEVQAQMSTPQGPLSQDQAVTKKEYEKADAERKAMFKDFSNLVNELAE